MNINNLTTSTTDTTLSWDVMNLGGNRGALLISSSLTPAATKSVLHKLKNEIHYSGLIRTFHDMENNGKIHVVVNATHKAAIALLQSLKYT